MGNCLPKYLKKKKRGIRVGPDPRTQNKTEDRSISEVLSSSSASVSATSFSSTGEVKMVEEISKKDGVTKSVESLLLEKETAIMDDIKPEAPVVKKPVFFQVDFVPGMHSMPQRLASRMEVRKEAKPIEQMQLTDEDEMLMDEIMVEYETQEKLRKLETQLRASSSLREQHLESIRQKARGSRAPTRAGDVWVGRAASSLREQHLESIRQKARGSRAPTRAGGCVGGERG